MMGCCCGNEGVVERMVVVKMGWWVPGNALSSIHSLSHVTY